MNRLGLIYAKLAEDSPTPDTPAPPDLPPVERTRGQFLRADNPYANLVPTAGQFRQGRESAVRASQQRAAADKARRDAQMQQDMGRVQGVRQRMDDVRTEHVGEMAAMNQRLDNANTAIDQYQTGAPRGQMLDIGPDRANVWAARTAAPEMVRQERADERARRPMSYSQLEDTYRRWGAGDAWNMLGPQATSVLTDMAGQTTVKSRQDYLSQAQNRRRDIMSGRKRRAPTNAVLGQFHQQYLRDKQHPMAASYRRWGLR